MGQNRLVDAPFLLTNAFLIDSVLMKLKHIYCKSL